LVKKLIEKIINTKLILW